MLIRPAHHHDAAALLNLSQQLGYTSSLEDVLDKLKFYAESKHDQTLVAEQDGKVLGMIVLNITRPLHDIGNWGRVSALVIDASTRSQGVGARLLAAGEAYCKEQGCTRVELSSGEHRADAHRFYLRQGYEDKPKRFKKSLPGS
jgi:GNAT superfamily N-acetyltransferase